MSKLSNKMKGNCPTIPWIQPTTNINLSNNNGVVVGSGAGVGSVAAIVAGPGSASPTALPNGTAAPMSAMSNYMTFYNWNVNGGTDYNYNIDMAGGRNPQHAKMIRYCHT